MGRFEIIVTAGKQIKPCKNSHVRHISPKEIYRIGVETDAPGSFQRKIYFHYTLKQKHMDIQVVVHTNDEEHSKAVIMRLVETNMSTKLDNYLNKFDKTDAEGMIEVTADKNKKGLFDGKIQSTLDGKSFRFEREDYKNLDDLINHLFDHFKQALSDM